MNKRLMQMMTGKFVPPISTFYDENTVPQSRVNEMNATHKTEIEGLKASNTEALTGLQKKIDDLTATVKATDDAKLADEGKTKELLENKTKELETLTAENAGLKVIGDKFIKSQKTRFDGIMETLKKDAPDQLKKMKELSLFKSGDTPDDVDSNLNLFDDLNKAEFFKMTGKNKHNQDRNQNHRKQGEKASTSAGRYADIIKT